MKIGYLLRMYPRFSQTFVVNEILELEAQGADISIVSLRLPNEGLFHETCSQVKARASYLPERNQLRRFEMLSTQVRAYRRKPHGMRRCLAEWRRRKQVSWFEIVQAVNLAKWAKKNRISALHVHFGTEEATVAMLANLLVGLPYSLTLHAFDIFRDNVDRSLLTRKINLSRFTITVSEFNRQFILKAMPDVEPDRVRVNYNGIDLRRFAPANGQRDQGSILAVGRLIEKKGFIHLVRAVGHLRDRGIRVKCQIVGEGREEKNLRREVKNRSLEELVTLPGRITQGNIARMMQEASVFVLPCVEAGDGNVDALPTVLLEALASGCPTVSTRLSGIPEIIDDNMHGLLVEPHDELGLADAIGRILEDGKFASNCSIEGRERARARFNIQANVGVMHEWLKQNGKNAQDRPAGIHDVSTEECAAHHELNKCHAGS